MTLKAVCAHSTLLVLAAVLAVAADEKPNFTGDWKLNAEKSDFFGQPGPSSLAVRIDHKEPAFKYSVTGSMDGNEFEESAEVTIGGGENTASNGMTLKAHWEGKVLVVEFKSPDGNMEGLARNVLSEDGKTFTRDATIKSSEGEFKQHIILDKQ